MAKKNQKSKSHPENLEFIQPPKAPMNPQNWLRNVLIFGLGASASVIFVRPFLQKDPPPPKQLAEIPEPPPPKAPPKAPPKEPLACESKPEKIPFLNYQEKVKVRRGPSESFEVVGSLTQGLKFSAPEDPPGWIRLDYGRYVQKKDLLRLDEPPEGEFRPLWVKKGVQILEYPFAKARPIKALHEGTKIFTRPFDDQWVAVSGGGYAPRAQFTSHPLYPEAFPARMKVVQRVNIRSGPSLKHPVVGVYFKDRFVQVQNLSGRWFDLGNQQYVAAKFLKWDPQTQRASR